MDKAWRFATQMTKEQKIDVTTKEGENLWFAYYMGYYAGYNVVK